jgi:hypothetical protein
MEASAMRQTELIWAVETTKLQATTLMRNMVVMDDESSHQRPIGDSTKAPGDLDSITDEEPN